MFLYLHPSIHLRFESLSHETETNHGKIIQVFDTSLNVFRSRQQPSILNSWRNTMSWISGESIPGQVTSGHRLEKRGRSSQSSKEPNPCVFFTQFFLMPVTYVTCFLVLEVHIFGTKSTSNPWHLGHRTRLAYPQVWMRLILTTEAISLLSNQILNYRALNEFAL